MPNMNVKPSGRSESTACSRRPRILITTIPKSGTHLIDSVLAYFPGLSRLRRAALNANLRWHPYNFLFWGGSRECQMGIGRPQSVKMISVRSALRRIREGQYGIGQVPYEFQILELVLSESLIPIALVRDPRDIAVSSMYHSLNNKRHILHREIAATSDPVARLRKILFGTGISTEQQLPIIRQLELFKGWTNAHGVLTLRFEDLVGPKGGGSLERQIKAILELSEHIGVPLTADDAKRIGETMFGTGLTFRRGQMGAWKKYFDEKMLEDLDAGAGDAVRLMGYDL